MKIIPNCIKTKRHLCASGSILLPLALRWRLVTVTLYALAASALPTVISSSAHAASLTISIPKDPLTVNVSANSNGGFSTASGTLKVSGDAAWGYTLTVKSGNEDKSNNLTTADGKNNILQSITEKVTTDASGNNFPNNSWGYMPSKLNSISNSQYLPSPTSEETTIDKTNTATDATGTTYNFTLAAKVDATQPAGLYSGSFTFTATANAINYNISYDCNGVAGCIENTKGQTQEKTTQLSSKEPTRDGYNFLGWCTSKPTPDKYSEDGCLNNGKKYDKSSAFELTDSANEVTLYAMWQKQLGFEEVYALNNKEKDGTTNHYKMQDMAPEICEHVTMPSEQSTATLVDVRDNNTYTVAKLLDGRCWMTQNLRIEGKTLTAADSDVSKEFILPASSLDGFKFQEYYDVADVYVDPGTEAGHENFGGYYTWYAATAGTGNSTLQPGEKASESICASAWRLPTGGSNSEFTQLSKAYGTNIESWTKQPVPGFVLAGQYGNGKYNNNNGNYDAHYYWSSNFARINNDGYYYAHLLRIYKHIGSDEKYTIEPTGGWAVHRGLSVRCIARNEE